MTRLWCPVIALFFISPLATAEIFKCTDGKGNLKLQNFPCPIDSIGSTATAVAPKEDGADPAPRIEQAPRVAPVRAPQAKPPLAAQTTAPQAPGEPGIGMTTDEVRAMLGEPTRTESSELDGFETWYYDKGNGDTRSLRFDKKGRVLLVLEQD